MLRCLSSCFRNGLGGFALRLMLALFVGHIVWACANIGSPEGGPYDMQAPRLLESNPGPRATGVKDKRIRLSFDEYVKLSKQDKVIISPPQHNQPRVITSGKSIVILLADSLRPETTYHLYFDDAVVDNNEDNAIEDFSFTFSTGTAIDTMQMSGVVIDARTLEPITDLVIGAYYADSLTNDSLALKTAFPFASKTNEHGEFTIRGLKDSLYRVFALKDNDNNYLYDGVSEGFAFLDKVFRTSKQDSIRTDTIRIDSVVRRDTIWRDSLITRDYTYYYPNDITLLFFTPESQRRGLEKYSRRDSLVLDLEFLSRLDTIPTLRSLDKPASSPAELYYATRDGNSIAYWIKNKQLIEQDSIRFVVDYQRTDSLMHLESVTDTLTFYKPRERTKEQTTKEKAEKRLRLSQVASSSFYKGTLRDSLILQATEPLDLSQRPLLHLNESLDSMTREITDYQISELSDRPLSYLVSFSAQFGAKYQLRIDSGAIRSIYGELADSLVLTHDVQTEKDLGALEVKVLGLSDSLPLIAEILDKSGEVLHIQSLVWSDAQPSTLGDSLTAQTIGRDVGSSPSDSTPASKGYHLLKLENIIPADYYLRLYIDANRDGKWTTGQYPYRSAEVVYYSPTAYSIKKGFTTVEEWIPLSLPLSKQKPEALRKAKPKEKQPRVDKNVEYYKKHPRKEQKTSKKRESKD